MNRQAVSFFVVGLLAGLLTATVGFALVVRAQKVAADGAALTLRLGHGLDVNHPVHAGMEMMAR